MIKVYICEDDTKQLQTLQQLVSKVIIDRQLDMGFGLTSADPHEILAHVKSQQPTQAVFLLDIALNSDINGIQLASQIRDLGIRSKIIFVTTHTELSLTVFQYQVEALDFILKDFPGRLYERLNTVLRVAQERFKAEDNDQNSYIQIKIGETIRSLDVQHVLFFESGKLQV